MSKRRDEPDLLRFPGRKRRQRGDQCRSAVADLAGGAGQGPSGAFGEPCAERAGRGRAHRTPFDHPYEGLQLGDWAVARTGAFYTKNAQDITVTKSAFDQLGGNGVFMDGYNDGNVVSGSTFADDGATDVQTVGSRAAVRDPSTWSHQVTTLDGTTPGPKTQDSPRNITVSGNQMSHNGRFEKQSAGVNISTSQNIRVLGNAIHGSPRSCVNINDGTWGGDLIQNNDIFDRVKETSDHGPINAMPWSSSARTCRRAAVVEDGDTALGPCLLGGRCGWNLGLFSRIRVQVRHLVRGNRELVEEVLRQPLAAVFQGKAAAALDELLKHPDDALDAGEQVLGHVAIGEHALGVIEQAQVLLQTAQVGSPGADLSRGVVAEGVEIDEFEAALVLAGGVLVRTAAAIIEGREESIARLGITAALTQETRGGDADPEEAIRDFLSQVDPDTGHIE